VLKNELLVKNLRPRAAKGAAFVTFMQHGFEKGDFRRILDICWFVAGPLIGMVSWREREIPGRESEQGASSWGKPGRGGKVRINGNRGAKNQILRWVVEVQRASGES
jgi:hypothetical protein